MQTKTISNLEQEVMDIVWKKNNCSVREVLAEMSKKRKIAYTTVQTILERLYEKGLLIKKKQAKACVYSPKITKESYTKTLAKAFINKFIGSFGDIAISSFAESIEDLPKKRREYLLSLLDEYEKQK